MIKVAAITSGKSVPSARFRVRQHVGILRQMGINVCEYVPSIEKYAPAPEWMTHLTNFGIPGRFVESGWRGVKRCVRFPGILKSRRSDVTWLERLLLPGRLTEEWLLKRPLVLDVDDAIWLLPPRGMEAAIAVAQRADVVLAGNGYISDWFSSRNCRTRVIPTAVDTERYFPRRQKNSGPITVGWIGTSSNLPYLEAIEAPLRRFLAQHPEARLLIVSNAPPSFRWGPLDAVRYIPWTEEGEADALREMDVGIMPLPDNKWTEGKCSFKMLQYMATGIPAVVSPVGMNRELLAFGRVGIGATDDDSWHESLTCYFRDPRRREVDGMEGRDVAERQFSKRIVAAALAEIFRELA